MANIVLDGRETTMKLIYLVQYFPPEKASGLQMVEDLIEGFANKGWEVDVFTPLPTRGVTAEERKKYKKKRVEKIYNDKVTIHRMRLYREGTSVIGRAVRYVLFSIECLWKCMTVPADFIFTGSGPPTQGVIVGLAKKLTNKKVIYNLQDIFPDSLVTSGICNKDSTLMKMGYKMEKFIYKNVDHIITVSEDMKNNIVRKGTPVDKISVILNWIDINKVRSVEINNNKLYKEFELSKDRFHIVYAGNLGKVQGVEVILEAAEQLLYNKQIHFVIFGNGSEENKLKSIAEKKKLDNVSIFPLQSSDRISEVYSLGDICIISCKAGTGKSGMPSKTWTIMAAERGIIASFDENSELSRTIKDADCGICVKADDYNRLAEAIIYAYNNRDKVEKWGNNARQYVEDNASKDVAVDKYITTIASILQE